jgi:beta-lactamase class D
MVARALTRPATSGRGGIASVGDLPTPLGWHVGYAQRDNDMSMARADLRAGGAAGRERGGW